MCYGQYQQDESQGVYVAAAKRKDFHSEHAGAKEWWALAVLTLAATILSIDNTVLSLAIPALSASLEPTANQVLWIGDIYSFTLAAALLVAGNLADKYGRKRMLLIGLVTFGFFSFIAAFSTDAHVLIAMRALLGISGAIIMPSTLALIRNIFLDDAQRTKAVTVWSAASTGGMALGPLVGGFLLEHMWWGSVFLVNVPIMVITIIGSVALLPESRMPEKKKIDLFSAFLSAIGMLLMVYAIKEYAHSGFGLAPTVSLAIGLALLVVFVMRQRGIPVPILDLQLFYSKSFSWALVVSLVSIFAFSGLFFFFSQYLQLVRGYSPLKAGYIEVVAMIFGAVAVVMVPVLTRRYGAGNSLALALLSMSLGFAVVGINALSTDFIGFIFGLAAIGFGAGIAYPVATDVLLSAAPPERAGAASSISETAYELGTALGIAILGSLVSFLYRVRLDVPSGLEPHEEAIEESLSSALKILHGYPLTYDSFIHQVKESFAYGMQMTSFVAAFVLFVCSILAFRFIGKNK
ncbi:MAG: MFS transporter [Actinomycetaceae bacterium]|nr:MFS transporter [Actinomycetaceae bacterium]